MRCPFVQAPAGKVFLFIVENIGRRALMQAAWNQNLRSGGETCKSKRDSVSPRCYPATLLHRVDLTVKRGNLVIGGSSLSSSAVLCDAWMAGKCLIYQHTSLYQIAESLQCFALGCFHGCPE